MPAAKVELNLAGFDQLRNSPGVKGMLAERAQKIADAAGGGDDYVTVVDTGPHRARAVVITATAKAMEEEAVNRTLTNAIDAGR